MGLFDFFRRYSPDETRYLNDLPPVLAAKTGLPPKVARAQAKQMVDMTIAKLREEGNYDMPCNLGDLILDGGTTQHRIGKVLVERRRAMLPLLRAEGVTVDDVRAHWNQSAFMLRMAVEILPNYFSIAFALRESRAHGRTLEQASATVRRLYPYFGDPQDQRFHRGEDRPLPEELIYRVNAWVADVAPPTLHGDMNQWNIGSFSSANAMVRSEIRAKRL